MAGNTTKAFLKTEGGTTIPCLFNPSELALSQQNAWSAPTTPGKGVQTLQYQGAQSGTLNLTLFFDTTATGTPVTTYTSKLVGLMDVTTTLPGTSATTNNARPPWVEFHWGTFHSFKAAITSLNLTFEYFSRAGVPLRARAAISLTQYQQTMAFGPQNPTSGTPRPHRVHRVQPGETLDRIAAMHLGDATKWRAIADANGITDPLALRPGRLLEIPKSS